MPNNHGLTSPVVQSNRRRASSATRNVSAAMSSPADPARLTQYRWTLAQ